MSAIPMALPAPAPRRARDAAEHRRPIEVVASRSQRRARPRLISALVTIGGLFAILAAQLLLTIATSEGAYEISSLQGQQSELARDQQVLVERLQVLGAPQHLAAEAQQMGMVASGSTAYLRLSDAVVLGVPAAASASSALVTAPDGSPLIPNRLLEGVPLSSAAPAASVAAAPSDAPESAASAAEAGAAGAPAVPAADGSVASTEAAVIPAPNTH